MYKNRIAFISENMSNPFSRRILKGILKGAEDHSYSVVTFSGEAIKSINADEEDPGNKVYELFNPEDFDGIIYYAGALGQFISINDFYSFCSRFTDLPSVNIGIKNPSGSSVLVDNFSGMYELITHLITVHDYKKIAFVKGPEDHSEAEERFKAYKKALQDKKIAFDPLLTAPGEFDYEDGRSAVKLFLDDRKLKVDAVAAVDDDTLLGVLDELLERGIKVPFDIAIAGFDNIEQAKAVTPPLSTVKQPIYRQGLFAVEKLFSLINGNISETFVMPTAVVLRESCGCIPVTIKNILSDTGSTNPKSIQSGDEKKTLYNLLGDLIDVYKLREKFIMDNNFLDQFINLFFNGDAIEFIQIINLMMAESDPEKNQIDLIQDMLTETEHFTESYDYSNKNHSKMIQSARVMLTSSAQRNEINKKLKIQSQMDKIEFLIRDLHFSFSLNELYEVFKNNLPEMGCSGFFINEYTSSEKKAALLFGFYKGESFIKENFTEFDSINLLPSALSTKFQHSNLIVVPLYFSEEQLGFMLFDIGSEYFHITDTLRWQVSAVIKRHQIMSENERVKKVLVEKNNKITAKLNPMADSVMQVTEMTVERVAVIKTINEIIDGGIKKIEETDKMIHGVANNISNMKKMIGMINDISESIHVLAINAAIQSSHAGNYGKAFSVIAKEIR